MSSVEPPQELATRSSRRLRAIVLGALLIVAYLAAVNRAQALPWLIAALLGGTLITGAVWPRWLVSRLSVSRTGPSRAHEGETIVFDIHLSNLGWLPRFVVELVDRVPFVGAAEGRVSNGETLLGAVACIAGGAKRQFPVQIVCEKRGLYRLGPVALVSSFPLGLMEARRQHGDDVKELTVYPHVFPIMQLPLRGTPSEIHRGGYVLPAGSGAAEFSGLREYQRGDNPRHIHWPTSARTLQLMVKEFEPLASASLCLLPDFAAAANVGLGKHSTFEYSMSIAASIARHADSNGIRTRLLGQGKNPLHLSVSISGEGFLNLLDVLAVVEPDGDHPYAGVVQQAAAFCEMGETIVAFISEPPDRASATLQALALLRARGLHVLAIVFRRDSFLAEGQVAQGPVTRRADDQLLAALLDIGAECVAVSRGDDLFRLFNP